MKWWQRAVAALAWLYAASLLLSILALRYVGERWWVTGVTLYLPRLLFAIPLPVIVLAILVLGPRRLLWTQLGAALLVLFPLMGLVLPHASPRRRDRPVMKVLSYNVDSGVKGIDELGREIDRYAPDIVALQEIGAVETFSRLLQARYPIVHVRNQFLLATRYPIVSEMDPDKLESQGRMRSPRFVQQVLDTPLGRMAVYNVHPISPREAFYGLRGTESRRDFLRKGILRDLFSPGSNAIFEGNAGLRALQVHTFAEEAKAETLPVLILGDTNLPGLSYILYRDLARFQDGFERAGSGFGYTFPSNGRPWMRIDRVLASDALRFVGFQVGDSPASDHRCVIAELQLDGP